MSDEARDGWPMSDVCCGLCDRRIGLDAEFHYARHGLSICSACAEAVANRMWKWATGEFLTWDDPDRLPATRPTKARIPEEKRWEVFARDGHQCLRCGSQKFLRADHVLPESQGGEASIDNLQTLCRSCNAAKGTKNEDYRNG